MITYLDRMKGIKQKFGVIFVGLFVLWTAFGFFVNYTQFDAMLDKEAKSDAERSAGILAAAVSRNMQYSDYDGMDSVLGALADSGDIAYIKVDDVVGGTVREIGEGGKEEGTVYATSPITEGEYNLGSVTVGLSSGASRKAITGYFVWNLLTVALLGFISLYVLLHSFRHIIMNPLSKVNAVLKSMAAGGGDLTQKLDTGTSDEIGELAANFNAFNSALRDLVLKAQGSAYKVLELAEKVGAKSKTFHERAQEQAAATNMNFKALETMDRSIQDVSGSADSLSMTSTDSSAIVTEMAAQVESVAGSTVDLTSHVEETSSSIAEMASSIKEVAENVVVLSDMASQTASTVNQIEASIREVEQRAKEAAELSQEVSYDADALGTEAIAKTIQGMDRIKTSVEDASEVIDILGARSAEIDQIVKVIGEVTNQTSLLALNASILAAQAGEHGKGFEVVASEIKDLAERTSASTGEISRLIKSVQQESKAAVESMRVGRERVLEGVKMAYGASDALNKILESSYRSKETAIGIEKATTQQVAAVREMTEAIMNVHERVMSIERATLEQTKGSELISGAAMKISDIAKEAKMAMEEQSRGITTFARSVEETKEMATNIAQAMKLQSEGSAGLISSMEKFLEIAMNNSEMSDEMESVAGQLLRHAEGLRDEMGRFKV